MRLMENLLTMEAEVKYLLGVKDRSYERVLMKKLLKILDEAEFLYGPRDRSYQLRELRITECAYAQTYVFYPLRMTRIYLTSGSKAGGYCASYELAHEAIHVLSPVPWGQGPTMLEEGLATYFSLKHVNRIYGLGLESVDEPKYEAALRAVSKLMAKNESVIKELRVRQPVISKIDERLLVEVAGIEPDHAKLLCTDFESYGGTTMPWSTSAARGAQRLVSCLRSIWD